MIFWWASRVHPVTVAENWPTRSILCGITRVYVTAYVAYYKKTLSIPMYGGLTDKDVKVISTGVRSVIDG